MTRSARRNGLRPVASLVSSAAVLVVAALFSSAEAECFGSLKCRHNTKCAVGPAQYSSKLLGNFPHLPFLQTTEVEEEHCVCPDDRTGVDCGTKIQICSDETEFPCLNNGECTPAGLCDCTTAHKDGNTMYAGSHCEFKAENGCETDDDGLETESWFCVNGGTCRDNESDINKKCNCDSEWYGPHCEFPTDKNPNFTGKHKSKKPEDCKLACENGGQCKFGAKHHGNKHDDVDTSALAWMKDKEIDGMHCVCPEGYAGVTCEVQVDQCAKGNCYYGAKCISEGDGDLDGKKHHCDCNTAGFDKNGGPQKRYAGEFCEHEATSVCEVLSEVEGKAGGMFCTNGGQCNKDEPHKGCDCTGTGYSGPMCEFKGGTEPECTLNCQNGGECRHGINPDVAGLLGTKFDLSLKSHSGFMHCSCPDGFIGADCGVKYEICGPEEELAHACANGGKCIVTGKHRHDQSKNKYACDCGQLNPFAGLHCEHPATVFCAKSEEGQKASYHSFCANGGKCLETITPTEAHPGCECGDGWEGDHCQYKFGTSPVEEVKAVLDEKRAKDSAQAMADGGGTGHKALLGVFIGIIVASVVIIGGVFAHKKLRSMAHNSGVNVSKDVNLAPAAFNDAEDNRPGAKVSVSLDGKMHDVEII